MKLNKSILNQLIREEIEKMEMEDEMDMEDDFDDLNPGKDAAEAAIMAAFAMNKDLPVDEIAKIAVKNLMRSFNITLKDEEKEEMSPEEYERLKMPGLDEEMNEQLEVLGRLLGTKVEGNVVIVTVEATAPESVKGKKAEGRVKFRGNFNLARRAAESKAFSNLRRGKFVD